MQEISHTESGATRTKLKDRVIFFFVAMGIITVTYGILFVIDFLPEKPSLETEETVLENKTVDTEVEEEEVVAVDPLPVTIIFDALDREVKILNPESETASVLDAALLTGVVRHPGSADFMNTGTIFLLGHSSYLPVVHNKNFQAFNGIQKLEWGDTIRLRSSDREYVYSVDRVYQTKSTEATVAIQHEVGKLILATCNSFGTKEDRFIVEATLVSSHEIPTDILPKG